MSRRSRSLSHTPTLPPITDEHKEWASNVVRQSRQALIAMNVLGLLLGAIVGTAFGVVDGPLAGVLAGIAVLLLGNVFIVRIWGEWRSEKKYLAELEETLPAEIIPPPPPAPHRLRRGRGGWRR